MPTHEITINFDNRPKGDLVETPFGAAENGKSFDAELTDGEVEAVKNTPGLSVKQVSGKKSESADARQEESDRQARAAVEYPKLPERVSGAQQVEDEEEVPNEAPALPERPKTEGGGD